MERNRLNRVYRLIDPRTRAIRYVGITYFDLVDRLDGHRHAPGNRRMREWIRELKGVGLVPEIEEIEGGLSRNQALEREAYWHRYYLDEGADLLCAVVKDYRAPWSGFFVKSEPTTLVDPVVAAARKARLREALRKGRAEWTSGTS